MKFKRAILYFIFLILLTCNSLNSVAHDIYFCGEKIPLSDRVADKLMDIIKKQIRYGIVYQLRLKNSPEMKTIEYYLHVTGLPEDFKYLAIVESGFKNVVSSAGAAGFWQLMEKTATQYGLSLSPVDERNNLEKSTNAALQYLAGNYKRFKKELGISSWVLTAASYNNGWGSIHKSMISQGKNNYFEMNLNQETAEYVYKIIAVKELFEYPELYMKNFGYNVFSRDANSKGQGQTDNKNSTEAGFDNMKVSVAKNPGKTTNPDENMGNGKVSYVAAHIVGEYENFKDSSEISVQLDEDLGIENNFQSSGKVITGIGWKVDDKVFIDFGYGRRLLLIDGVNKKHDGILLSSLKNKADIMLKLTAIQK